VFVDDNPVECDLVRRELPEVGVVHIDSDPTQFIAKFEAGCWFTATHYTQEDRERSNLYSARKQALEEMQDHVDLPSFLRGLGMKARIAPFMEADVERLAQMESKTNQFNLTTRRYSAEQIRELMKRDDVVGRSLRLTDKFGDHGLVSSLIAIVEQNTLRIDSWLMSCRVFSRSAEHAMFNHLVDVAYDLGVTELIGQYIPTAKNGVVASLYKSLGFDELGQEGYWKLALNGDVKVETFVDVTNVTAVRAS
jgi:FkbH-like protein